MKRKKGIHGERRERSAPSLIAGKGSGRRKKGRVILSHWKNNLNKEGRRKRKKGKKKTSHPIWPLKQKGGRGREIFLVQRDGGWSRGNTFSGMHHLLDMGGWSGKGTEGIQ